MLANVDIHYDLGPGHPLLGRRMPDLDVITDHGSTRVYALLHDARGVLLDPGGLGISGWADWVRRLGARYEGAWVLSVLRTVSPPAAVLNRWFGSRSEG